MSRQPSPPAIGAIVKSIRKRRNLTLEQLAQRSHVSKSMLSQIERELTNPTIATLWSLAHALDVSITELVSKTHDENAIAPAKIEVMRSHYTPTIASQDGKCKLRILSPISSAGASEWYELVMEPDACLESEPHASGSYEHLTVLSGHLLVSSGTYERSLNSGDTARYPVDIKHQIQNMGEEEARALLVYVLA